MTRIPAQRDADATAEQLQRLETQIVADLLYIRENWGTLQESRMRGTPLPWTQRRMSDAAMREADTLARTERRERSASAIGEHPAPVHVEPLDAVITVETAMRDLRRACRGWLAARLDRLIVAHDDAPDPTRALKDQINNLGDFLDTYTTEFHWSAVWITDALEFLTDTTSRGFIADTTRRMAKTVRDGIDDYPRRPFPAPCIACGRRTLTYVTRGLEDAYIVCTNLECFPAAGLCGNSDSAGQPMWPRDELEWLATQMDDAAKKVTT